MKHCTYVKTSGFANRAKKKMKRVFYAAFTFLWSKMASCASWWRLRFLHCFSPSILLFCELVWNCILCCCGESNFFFCDRRCVIRFCACLVLFAWWSELYTCRWSVIIAWKSRKRPASMIASLGWKVAVFRCAKCVYPVRDRAVRLAESDGGVGYWA